MYVTRFHTATVVLLLASNLAAADVASDWPRWRGPQDNGSTETGTYCVQFDESTTRWRARLPGKGCSTPVVLNRTIYLTAPVNGDDALLSLDWSGNQRWSTTFGPETTGKHRNGSGCNASPVTDGSAVFVYFKSGTLAAVELDGAVRWKADLVERFGEDQRFWDHGTSPVLTDKYVIMARMHAGDSWLAAFDKTSGDLVWKVVRNYSTPLEGDQCYTTPLVIRHAGKQAVLVWGAQHLTIHDAADGLVRWSCGSFNPDSQKVVARHCDAGDRRRHGRDLLRTQRPATAEAPWNPARRQRGRDGVESRLEPRDVGSFVPSPVVYRGHVYLVRDRGEVECIDPATGKTMWSEEFPKGRASYYASPIIAGGNLYAAREDGKVFVAAVTSGRFKLLAENDMDEPVIGSPVPACNCIFIRGEDHLFCLASPGVEGEPAGESP